MYNLNQRTVPLSCKIRKRQGDLVYPMQQGDLVDHKHIAGLSRALQFSGYLLEKLNHNPSHYLLICGDRHKTSLAPRHDSFRPYFPYRRSCARESQFCCALVVSSAAIPAAFPLSSSWQLLRSVTIVVNLVMLPSLRSVAITGQPFCVIFIEPAGLLGSWLSSLRLVSLPVLLSLLLRSEIVQGEPALEPAISLSRSTLPCLDHRR